MTKDEALTLALEALRNSVPTNSQNAQEQLQAIIAIKEALNRGAMDSSPNGEAQPEQRSNEHLEPVAWRYALTVEGTEVAVRYDHANWNMKYEPFGRHGIDHGGKVTRKPVYTTPPQRTAAEGEDTRRAWVELTTDDWDEIRKQVKYNFEMTTGEYAERVSHLVEDKLREKNT